MWVLETLIQQQHMLLTIQPSHLSSPSFPLSRKPLGVLHRMPLTSYSSCFSFQDSRTRAWAAVLTGSEHSCVRFLDGYLHLNESLVRFMTCRSFYYLTDLFIFFPFCVSLCVMYVCICVSLYMWQHRCVHNCACVCMCVETPVAASASLHCFPLYILSQGCLLNLELAILANQAS